MKSEMIPTLASIWDQFENPSLVAHLRYRKILCRVTLFAIAVPELIRDEETRRRGVTRSPIVLMRE